LGLYLPQQVPVGLLANICWDESAGIQTVVRYCRAGESQFVAGLMHLPIQRRTADRKQIRKPGKLYWDDVFDGRMAFPVELCDVSSGGLRFHSASSIPVPMIV
jgi:hypothetical protein